MSRFVGTTFNFELICIIFIIILSGKPLSIKAVEADTSHIGNIGVGVVVGFLVAALLAAILLLLWNLKQ